MPNENEPLHTFLSDTPESPAEAKAYQRGFDDGLTAGKELGMKMLSQFISQLHTMLGESKIEEITEARIQQVRDLVSKMHGE